MIDTIMDILEGIQNRVDFKKLIAQTQPLGRFPEMNAMEIASSDLAVLYETVLIDTPLSDLFSQYLEEKSRDLRSFQEVQSFLKEEKTEKIRNGLKKILYEKFFKFTQGLNQTSAESFREIL